MVSTILSNADQNLILFSALDSVLNTEWPIKTSPTFVLNKKLIKISENKLGNYGSRAAR